MSDHYKYTVKESISEEKATYTITKSVEGEPGYTAITDKDITTHHTCRGDANQRIAYTLWKFLLTI